MTNDPVLVEAEAAFVRTAKRFLIAAKFEPVIKLEGYSTVRKLLHQLPRSTYRDQRTLSVTEAVNRIQKEVARTRERHLDWTIVFWAPNLQEERYLAILSELHRRRAAQSIDLAVNAWEAVARLLQRTTGYPMPEKRYVLDQIEGIDGLGDDLRDDATGKLDAKKVAELFDMRLARIAAAAGVARQSLDENPTSEKAQPLLRLFERVARLRAHPQVKDDAALRKWFRRGTPMLSGNSPDDLFNAGKLDVVAEKVDQLLTGDFGG
jgi:hypothetical protein